MTAKRPNILLIHSDQHRFDCVGINGHQQIKTPNLDRLANEGVNFTQAYTPTPICSPARASLVTGQWPTQHGCVNISHTESHHCANLKSPALWQLINNAGYHVGMVGKFHQEVTGLPTDHGVDDWISEGQYNHWRETQNIPSQPRTQIFFGELDEHITSSQSRMAWEVDNVLALIDKYENDQANDAWFMRWDPSEPHLPNIIPAELANLYPTDSIKPWPGFPDDMANKPYSQKRCIDNWGIANWPWEKWQPVVSRYLAEITLLDQQLGRILKTLENKSILDNTLIIYSTDHGDMCGGHGMIDKHFSMYDDIVRVPMMMRYPGQLKNETPTCDAFVIHEMDIAATLCTAAGVTCPDSYEGRDLVAVVNGDDHSPREDAFGMYQGAQQGLYSIRMVRDRDWKYVFHPTDRHELYHVSQDPGELVNLINEPSAKPELDRLRGRMIQWMESIGDPLLNPWMRSQLLPDEPSPLLPENLR
jgi:arylsulfatase A-like enzyme